MHRTLFACKAAFRPRNTNMQQNSRDLDNINIPPETQKDLVTLLEDIDRRAMIERANAYDCTAEILNPVACAQLHALADRMRRDEDNNK